MRKTPGINPHGFEKDTWNYRIRQLRRALGWTQYKLARVMGVSRLCVWRIEIGKTLFPDLNTIGRIKAVEEQYQDIIKKYKKEPERMNRLINLNKRKSVRGGVHLLPIEIRRPKDLETLEDVGTNSDPMFFGRKTRRLFPNTGLPPKEAQRRKNSARTRRENYAKSRVANGNNKSSQSGQSTN